MVLLIVLVQVCSAFGPLFHQASTSASVDCLSTSDKANSCFSDSADAATYSLILGGSGPDAIKNISARLHSLEFAGFAYQFSLNASAWTPTPGALFDGASFALGLGYHLSEDYIGHYPSGYLTPSYDHPLEFAVDAWVQSTYFSSFSPLGFPGRHFNDEAKRFVFEAQKGFGEWTARVTPASPYVAVDEATVADAISRFDGLVSLEGPAAAADFLLFKSQLAQYDYCGSADADAAIRRLQASLQMCLDTGKFWAQTIVDPAAQPQLLDDLVQKYVAQQYANIGGTICTVK